MSTQMQPRKPSGTPIGGQYDNVTGGGRAADLEQMTSHAQTFSAPMSVDSDLQGVALPEISVFRGEDGALVIQVDTNGSDGRVRINLNDAPVWDGDPEVGPIQGDVYDRAEEFWQSEDRFEIEVEADGSLVAGPYTLPASEHQGNVDAMSRWADKVAVLTPGTMREWAINRAVAAGKLSPSARDTTDPSFMMWQYAESNAISQAQAADELGIPAVLVSRRRFTEDHVHDGDIDAPYDTEIVCPDSWDETVRTFRDNGLSFEGEVDNAYHPDGSTVVDYRTGEREEVSATLVGPWTPEASRWVSDQVG
jgi:hypothetical protein